MRARKKRSESVSDWLGRMRPRRVKRTSLGVCSRDEVRVNMFSGEKKGKVKTKAMTAEIKRILRPLNAADGTG